VGTLPLWFDGKSTRVLLCKRNIEPRFGKWTLPAGFLELHESALEGAIRETWEEAGIGGQLSFAGDPLALRPYAHPFFAQFDVLSAGQIYQFYRVEVLNPELYPGTETQEARYFTEEEIPWNDIAFTAVQEVLNYYFKTAKLDSAEQIFASVYQKTL
jgi:ADP-ribose pyrophosphatase YjhB (NUDIX family)